MRSDVSGVRSSCPASATSCRSLSRAAANEASIVLKLEASRPISSLRTDSIGVRSIVRCHAFGRCSQRPQRCQPGSCDAVAGGCRGGHAEQSDDQ